jgi:HK97 family phage portal protein
MPFNWFRKKQSEVAVEKKAAKTTIPVAPGSFLNYLLTGGGPITASQAMNFYRENSAVATAVDMIAGSFEQIQPVLETKSRTGEKIFDSDHEVIQKLRKPNEFDAWMKFAGDISRHYLLTHDSIITLLGNVNRPPLACYSVKPQELNVIEDPRDKYPKTYMIPQGAGHGVYERFTSTKGINFFDGPLKELYHIMGFSSRASNLTGDSPLEAAALDAKQQIEGSVHNLQLIKNGGRLSLIFSFKDNEPLDDDEHKERKKRIYEDLSGSNNAGKIAVISGTEVDITEAGINNKDMDYANLMQMANFSIYNRYRIPLPLITTTAAKFNNMQMAVEQLYDFAVLPHADIMFGGLSLFFLPRYGINPMMARITYNPDTITALKKRRLEELKERKKMNLETTNELRKDLARKPAEGGDVIYQPANFVPMGTNLLNGEEEEEDPEEAAKRLLDRDGLN